MRCVERAPGILLLRQAPMAHPLAFEARGALDMHPVSASISLYRYPDYQYPGLMPDRTVPWSTSWKLHDMTVHSTVPDRSMDIISPRFRTAWRLFGYLCSGRAGFARRHARVRAYVGPMPVMGTRRWHPQHRSRCAEARQDGHRMARSSMVPGYDRHWLVLRPARAAAPDGGHEDPQIESK